MIAKITRGQNPGDIGAYLHGPGHSNEHKFTLGSKTYPGGIVMASNIGMEGHTDPKVWAGELRKAAKTRAEIKNPIWQTSLRLAEQDRTLDNSAWADIAQTFAEGMGFAEHPWVAVRHGDDHIHIVTSRVNDGVRGRIARKFTLRALRLGR